MELGLRHRALQAKQKPVVKSGWIVEPVFIEDEGAGHGADFQQMMPVERTARETGDFQTHDQADMTKPHLGDQALKALAIGSFRSRLTQVLINDHNARGFPPQRNRSLAQGILTRRILEHLRQGTLAHVQHGLTRKMSGGNFVQGRGLKCTH
jgi:hypothetical protein